MEADLSWWRQGRDEVSAGAKSRACSPVNTIEACWMRCLSVNIRASSTSRGWSRSACASESAYTHLNAIAVPLEDEDDEGRMARLEGGWTGTLPVGKRAVAGCRQAGLDLAMTERSESRGDVVLVEPHLGCPMR